MLANLSMGMVNELLHQRLKNGHIIRLEGRDQERIGRSLLVTTAVEVS